RAPRVCRSLSRPSQTASPSTGEAVVGWGAVWLGDVAPRHLRLSLGAEAFGWGRLDVDGRLAVQLARRNVELAVTGLVVGMGRVWLSS
ncbi:hypothetical protein ACLESO_60000, partial [Pyxidicoccus sp. 3LG]